MNNYDVIVIGTGAGGGMVIKTLCEAGLKVCALNAGRELEPAKDFREHKLPYDLKFRGFGSPAQQARSVGYMDNEYVAPDAWEHDIAYSTSEGTRWTWPRSNAVGGKTNFWGRSAARMSQIDFKAASRDGYDVDWPVSYEEIAPYYTRVEEFIGVASTIQNRPSNPDGSYLPPMRFRCLDRIMEAGAKKTGIPYLPDRMAQLTQAHNGHPSCHFCGNCTSGCDVVAKYNSADVQMYPAVRAGKPLTLQPNSIVYELGISDEARVSEVRYIDRETGKQNVAKGRVVVVACACVQSVALLMMSKSSRFSTGLANSSGHLGQDFIPHITCGVEAFLEPKIGKPTVNDEGFLDHAYLPSFMHSRKRDYPRSFGAQFNYQNRRSVGWARSFHGMGKDYKDSIRAHYPAYVTFNGYTEMLPNARSFVDLDPSLKDTYGIPLPRRHWSLSESDWTRYNDMKEWSQQILKASGGKIHSVSKVPETNHEIGGCRMGSDPRTSVLDATCRAHDVPNLYVADASVFPNASEKNPTLTIMALALRTAETIANRLKTGEV